MRIAVFGSTGAVGRLVVRAALAEGHEVVAHARSPQKLGVHHPALRVIGSSLTDDVDVARAVAGADAVISALGPSPLQRGTPIGEGTERIVAAMRHAGVDRLVAIATPTAPDPADGRDLRMAAIVRTVRIVAPGPRRDVLRTADAVRSSGLRWTLARLPMLRGGDARPVRTGPVGESGLLLTRAALAAYLLDAATSDRDVHAAPVVSDAG
ncbi:NAD(P)-dependent oxidoreductase [Patulibacter sp.]|uniref:NAD(P)-dependent oxidoreductase n=1 Tax=Patulibacter sp. TaxID=1912859 RepID=UPI00272178E3|nr:NAD(P)H-binding protein [Patulibacter sp.]MDO9407332.1 NAD(P)H-binding protein [Patulibacter sp.]